MFVLLELEIIIIIMYIGLRVVLFKYVLVAGKRKKREREGVRERYLINRNFNNDIWGKKLQRRKHLFSGAQHSNYWATS